MKGRRPESAFGAFTEHFPPRTGFVVREITERRRLPGAGARRPAAEHRAGDTEAASDGGPAALSPAPKHSHPTSHSHLFPKRCFEGGLGRRPSALEMVFRASEVF